MDEISDHILYLKSKYNQCIGVCVSGDFNCRIGKTNISNVSTMATFSKPRVAVDNTCNNRGKIFVKFIDSNEFILHNGYVGDE